jgi:hypothetical protein
MSKIQMIQKISVPGVAILILFLPLGHLIFEFVSNFEIRVSNFASIRTADHALRAYAKVGLPGPGFLLHY